MVEKVQQTKSTDCDRQNTDDNNDKTENTDKRQRRVDQGYEANTLNDKISILTMTALPDNLQISNNTKRIK